LIKIYPHNPPPILYHNYTILTQNLEEPKNNRPQSKIGKLITDKYDTCIDQTENTEAIETQISQRMQSEALQKVKEAFLRAVKPLIPQSETGNLNSSQSLEGFFL
jgi:hypothetical protein